MAKDQYDFIKAPRLTTVDNPYNPFTQWDEWFAYDTFYGYNTCGVLALRTASLKEDEMSDYDYAVAVDSAIKDLVADFPLLYRRVTEDQVAINY